MSTLDFSAFTSIGLGRSRSCNSRISLLTASTLVECFKLCPNVQEVFLSESLEADIDAEVLRILFTELKHLKAVDFCAADSPEFVREFTRFLESSSGTWISGVQHLSLHNCSTMPTNFFNNLLPHFNNLKRLDLYNTQVSGTALLSIDRDCRLASLNLSQCTRITAIDLVAFVMDHPASRSLRTFSLLYSWNKTHPLSTMPQALDAFVQAIPRDLEILDLAGVELDLQHLSYLPPRLIELGAHDIDIGEHYSAQESGDVSQELSTRLQNLRYLLLTQTVISSETKFAAVLSKIFPSLSIIECPGFSRLPSLCSKGYEKVDGIGRRDWIRRRQSNCWLVEQSNSQFHPRKSNMSLKDGSPRGIYDYYSYRV